MNRIKILFFAPAQGQKGFVAQLDRASDYGSEGLGFESLRDRTKKAITYCDGLFFFSGYLLSLILTLIRRDSMRHSLIE